MAIIGDDGVDPYNIRDIPFSINRDRLDDDVVRMMKQGENSRARLAAWDESAAAYPAEISTSRNAHMWAFGTAVLLTPFWALGWGLVLLSFAVFGLVAVGAVLVLWVVCWTAVFAAATMMYAYRLEGERDPVATALETARGNIWRWQGITLVYPLYVFPKSGKGLVTAFFAPDALQPDEEDAYAIRVMSDTRVLLVLTVNDDISVINTLALQLRRETAMLHMHAGSIPTIDVGGLKGLVTEMRTVVLRKIAFLVLMFPEAEIGDFHDELVEMMTANAERIARAAVPRNRRESAWRGDRACGCAGRNPWVTVFSLCPFSPRWGRASVYLAVIASTAKQSWLASG